MINWEVGYTAKSKTFLKQLPSNTSSRIIDKIEFYNSTGNPLKYAKKLKKPKLGTYRFRIGSYRAIFDVDDKGNIKILMILLISHRKDIYKNI
jgi:mRNA interferase RelE/StbE